VLFVWTERYKSLLSFARRARQGRCLQESENCVRCGIPVSNPSHEHLGVCVSVLIPQSENRSKRASETLESRLCREPVSPGFRTSNFVTSSIPLALSHPLCLFLRLLFEKETERNSGRRKINKEEEEKKEKVQRHPKMIFIYTIIRQAIGSMLLYRFLFPTNCKMIVRRNSKPNELVSNSRSLVVKVKTFLFGM